MSFQQVGAPKGGIQDVQMSQDEIKRFSQAMEKPEFVELLGDYMKEISDPKNRAEYDAYLKQLEKDQELPKGTELLKPNVGFCFKTSLYEIGNKNRTQKMFVNVGYHSKVQKPSCKNVTQNGKQGQQWSLPYVVGKVRLDQDNTGAVCSTIEIVFHDDVIKMCNNPAFQNLVCDTSLDGVDQQLKERKEKVSRDYKVMQNMKCKGGEPATLTIRSQFLQDPKSAQEFNDEMSRRQKSEDAGPKLYQEFMNQQTKHKEEKNKQTQQSQQSQEQEEEIEIQEEPKEKQREITSIEAPKYTLKYSYSTEYSDFLDFRQQKQKKQPKDIVLEINLPRIVIILVKSIIF